MRKSYKRIIVIFILNFRYKKFIKKTPHTSVADYLHEGLFSVLLKVFNFYSPCQQMYAHLVDQ